MDLVATQAQLNVASPLEQTELLVQLQFDFDGFVKSFRREFPVLSTFLFSLILYFFSKATEPMFGN